MLFEQCPSLYKDRYIDGVASDPSLPMLFGSAVHIALEALHQGHRQACLERASPAEGHYLAARAVYSEQFDAMQARLAEMGLTAPPSLYAEGLKAIDQVAELSLNADGQSEAERWFTLPTPTWGAVTVGAVDLWSPPWSTHGPTVWDFKTTVGKWGPDRVQRETWQPLLYTWAYKRAYGVIPTFVYIVLNRMTGERDIMQRSWSLREWEDDMALLRDKASAIAELVAYGDFDCPKAHGNCLECGEPYGHHHVCREGSRPTQIKLTRVRGTTWAQPALDLA
jgi:hypothetical protein